MTAQQLKNSILQMAVQGKLVPQDPNDEPASVLLDRIRAEKEEMVKEGKIKKEKNPSVIFRGDDGLFYEKVGDQTPVCIEDELPFDIPESWGWVRLTDICEYIQRGKSPKYSPIKKYPVIAQKCNQWDGFSIEKAKFIDPDSINSYGEERILQNNDLMWNSTGLGTLGRMAIYKEELNPYELAVADSHVTVIRPLKKYIKPEYLYFYFAGPSVQLVIENLADGSTKQKELSTATIKNYLVPIPPCNEQNRILDKLQEALSVVKQYGFVEQDNERLNDQFPVRLKKSILQLAVQGKLVPQDPSDEPASVLLERIRAEKEQLIESGRIKRDKHESVIYSRDDSYYEKVDGVERCIDDEVPFDIPGSWEWVRLSAIAETNIGLTYRPSDKVLTGGIIVLRSNNIQKAKMDYSDVIRVSCQVPERSLIHRGDILICVRNGSRALVGKSAIVEKEGMAFGAFMAKVSSPIANYIFLFLQSPAFRFQLNKVNTETINQITQNMLKWQLIPVPPLAEQERIVKKLSSINEKINCLCR